VEQHRGVLEQLPGRTLVALSPWAATVAVLGADQLQRGQTAVPELLEPLYVRPSYAEEKRAAAGG
jgi:tRNA A37 threonylcarbamoyladenosine modification protein TsaB